MNDQSQSFSKRHGLTSEDAPITIRQEAPDWLRTYVVAEAQAVNLDIQEQRIMVCRMLYESPDLGNWSAGNVEGEVRCLLQKAEWFYIYDYIEHICANLEQHRRYDLERFTNRINEAFRRKGIGWQLQDGRIEIRGEESFEASVRGAVALAETTGRPTAKHELHQALADLSKRPAPDITGAIQHAGAALECVARDVTGDPKPTLGEITKKFPDMFPAPLGQVVEKI